MMITYKKVKKCRKCYAGRSENTTTIVLLFREDLAGIIAAIEGTIGDGFEHVLLLDVLCAFQIGYRARDFQYTVIRTRREA